MSGLDYTLYLVTDTPERYQGGLLAGVEAAVAGGASIVQYRAITGTRRQLYETARALHNLLRPRGVPLIINDQVDLALAIDAEGVHVGQNDLPVEIVRQMIGPKKLLGLSITAAAQLDAIPAKTVDYLGIGPVFPTISKDDAAPALGLEQLAWLTARTTLPVVAIGGISLENAAAVFATGVAGLAVVSALSLVTDPSAAARSLRQTKPHRP
jgi:thiamine-phosphate pyrophosphorylase